MNRRAFFLTLLAAHLSGTLFGQTVDAINPALKLERVIPLPGVEGRIDHLAADINGRRLFVAALGNGTVETVDMARGKSAGTIRGLKEPQGLLYRQQNNTIYVATGGDGVVRAYNGRTYTPAGLIALGDDADNLRYDHRSDSLLVGYGDGAIAFLPWNLQGRPKTEVPLPVHPESFQISSDGSHLIINLPNDQSIAFVGIESKKIESKWTHLGAQSNFPMAVDPERHRFFVACRAPAQLLELRENSPAVAQRISTVGDADDLFWDKARSRLYVIGGEGYVDVIDARPDSRMKSTGHIQTAAGARTGLLVPAWNKLIVAAPHRGTDPAQLLVFDVE